MDRDRLAKLRKKSADNKVKKHQELLDSNASIKESIDALSTALNEQQPYDDSKLVETLAQLKESQTFSQDIKRLEDALRESSDKEKLDEIVKAVGNINNADVVNAVNDLIVRLEDNTVEQDEESFRPVRRVIKIAGRLVFDDAPTPGSVGGGGGVQSRLTRSTDDGHAIAVVNPDGSNIGGGGGGNTTVDNFPSEYPLPSTQVATLTPQTDALTDSELRATPLDVNFATTNYTTRIATNSVNVNLTYIGNAAIGSLESAAVWQIKRLDSTTGLVKLWASGNDTFNKVWNNREALTYS